MMARTMYGLSSVGNASAACIAHLRRRADGQTTDVGRTSNRHDCSQGPFDGPQRVPAVLRSTWG